MISGISNLLGIGRTESSKLHHVLKTPLIKPPSDVYQSVSFGMGCFWGAERKFWQTGKVVSTSVGYQGGNKVDPTYEEVCTGKTGHIEVVNVAFDNKEISFKELLDVFWANHDPTQLNRQGNDRGTQYCTAIFYYNEEQKQHAEQTRDEFQKRLSANGYGEIVTKILDGNEHPFYFAEDYHQQYLSKNPNGYCGLKGTGCYDPDTIRLTV